VGMQLLDEVCFERMQLAGIAAPRSVGRLCSWLAAGGCVAVHCNSVARGRLCRMSIGACAGEVTAVPCTAYLSQALPIAAMSDDQCMRSLAAVWSYAVQRMNTPPLNSGQNGRIWWQGCIWAPQQEQLVASFSCICRPASARLRCEKHAWRLLRQALHFASLYR
jgi:hypothetical protein